MPQKHSQTKDRDFGSPLEGSWSLKLSDYVHPREIVQDDRLGPAEKRAMLSAWASDACAMESRPGFRWLPGTPGPILVHHVLAALRSLDEMTGLRVAMQASPAGGVDTPYGGMFTRSPKRGFMVDGLRH